MIAAVYIPTGIINDHKITQSSYNLTLKSHNCSCTPPAEILFPVLALVQVLVSNPVFQMMGQGEEFRQPLLYPSVQEDARKMTSNSSF